MEILAGWECLGGGKPPSFIVPSCYFLFNLYLFHIRREYDKFRKDDGEKLSIFVSTHSPGLRCDGIAQPLFTDCSSPSFVCPLALWGRFERVKGRGGGG